MTDNLRKVAEQTRLFKEEQQKITTIERLNRREAFNQFKNNCLNKFENTMFQLIESELSQIASRGKLSGLFFVSHSVFDGLFDNQDGFTHPKILQYQLMRLYMRRFY